MKFTLARAAERFAARATSRRSLHSSRRGAGWVGAILVLTGLALLIVGVIFWLSHPLTWETAIGFTLFGLGVLFAAGITWGGGKFAALASVALVIAGAGLLIAHYLGFI